MHDNDDLISFDLKPLGAEKSKNELRFVIAICAPGIGSRLPKVRPFGTFTCGRCVLFLLSRKRPEDVALRAGAAPRVPSRGRGGGANGRRFVKQLVKWSCGRDAACSFARSPGHCCSLCGTRALASRALGDLTVSSPVPSATLRRATQLLRPRARLRLPLKPLS